jgi:septal ring factor EnvC (AmiA/AmiB activator)
MEKIEQVEKTILEVSDEKRKLDSEKKLKSEVVENLNKKEKELASNQKKIQAQADVLKNKIEQTIQEENRNGSNAPGTAETPSQLLTEEIVLTQTFTASKGKLPWPLENGIISSEFGEHDHPDLKGIKIKNNGINIVTSPGSKARAIFDGVVTRVMKVPSFNNVVIIRHGEYLSVYSNLDQVFVSKESKVKSGQDIGTIFAASEKQKSELHFEIWKGKNHLNPVQWISSTNN